MEEEEEVRPKTVPFIAENGDVVDMYVLEETTLQDIHYILVTEQLEEEGGECFVTILKEERQKQEQDEVRQKEDEFAVYDMVEDEAELQAVAKVFAELMEDVDFRL